MVIGCFLISNFKASEEAPYWEDDADPPWHTNCGTGCS